MKRTVRTLELFTQGMTSKRIPLLLRSVYSGKCIKGSTDISSDWERVIIIHSRDDSNNWAPSRALLSAHSGYNNLAWGDIQNTLTTDEINAGNAKDPNGVQNNDHPKVYVAWSKHPNFDDRNTGWNDPASQSLDKAFRSDDWWYYVDPQYYIRSDPSTDAGQALGAADWGDATSNPPSVHAGVCDAS